MRRALFATLFFFMSMAVASVLLVGAPWQYQGSLHLLFPAGIGVVIATIAGWQLGAHFDEPSGKNRRF